MRRSLLAVLVLSLLSGPAAAQAPKPGALMRVPGMVLGGTITRDANGIPYIWALTPYDLFFLQGWQHAEDRFFQMDYYRHVASGTLAELVGGAAIGNDVQLRVLGLRRAAALTLSSYVLSSELVGYLTAYSAGVNAWLASHPLPAEYAALELTKVEPWSEIDCVVIGKLFAFQLSFDFDTDPTVALLTYQAAGSQLGFDGTKFFFEDVWRVAPFEPMTTIPSSATSSPDEDGGSCAVPMYETEAEAITARERFLADAAGRARELVDAGYLDLLRSYRAQLAESPVLTDLIEGRADRGSNEWVLGPSRTTTGNAILANDPHLSLSTPSTFYTMSLRGGPFNAAGSSFPGVPFIVLGGNEKMCWGSTWNPLDVNDFYAEQVRPDSTSLAGLGLVYKGKVEPLSPVLDTFRQNVVGNGVKDDLQTLPAGGAIPQAILVSPRHGPVVALDTRAGTAVTVQYTGSGATKELETFMRFNKATSFAEWKAALDSFDVGSQNFCYADTDGTIAYYTSAELPLREDLQAGTVRGLPPFLLRDGTGGNDWLPATVRQPGQASASEILPPAEMPHVENPAQGYFINANNDPIGNAADNNLLNQLRPGGGIFYLANGYDSFRGARIQQLIQHKLAGGGKLGVADVKEIQGDAGLIDAAYFVPHIVSAFDNGKAAGADPTLAALASNPALGAIVGLFRTWDFSAPTGIPEGYDASDVNGQLGTPSAAEISASVAATFYAGWRSRFIANTVDAILGLLPAGTPGPPSGVTLAALRNVLATFPTRKGVGASGVPFFNVPQASRPEDKRDIVILKSLADALTLFTGDSFAAAFGKSADLMSYRWGKLHRITFAHPLGGPFDLPSTTGAIKPPLAGLPGFPRQGGFGTVDAASHSVRAQSVNGFMYGSGPTRRYVADVTKGGWPSVEASTPGGVSGVPSSPLYANLLFGWLTNETYGVFLQEGPRLPW